MKSERKDLIELCMGSPGAGGYISRAMKAMPDSAFRRELILLLLRAPIKWWPDIPGGVHTDMERMWAVNSITEYVGQYLPDTPITWEVIGSPERRLKLADDFEAAVARVTAAAQTRTNPRPAAGLPPTLAGSDPSAARRAVPNETGSAFNGAYAGLWIAGVLLLVAAAVWYGKCRGQARRTGHSAKHGGRDT